MNNIEITYWRHIHNGKAMPIKYEGKELKAIPISKIVIGEAGIESFADELSKEYNIPAKEIAFIYKQKIL